MQRMTSIGLPKPSRGRWRWCLRAVLCLGPALGLPAQADDATAGWAPVADGVLAECRGGFDLGNGLVVSLSIERLLSVNGNVVASSQLNLADVGKAGGADALQAFQAMQAGAGNQMLQAATAAPTPMTALVLQNSANDQLLRGQTTINTTVNSLAILKDLNFGDSLRQALSTAIPVR